MIELDPRWEWIHTGTWGMADVWIRGRCRHLDPQPVELAEGVLMCPDCGLSDLSESL